MNKQLKSGLELTQIKASKASTRSFSSSENFSRHEKLSLKERKFSMSKQQEGENRMKIN